ncbi:MFS transporter [Mobilicoccus caccae]|uniref:MFS transporter n=1 Tax=Mobilicoccus caccae TaxID=1859295 RepID=A0ABQ6IL26_9MICO|nr:MFS transporter [Mobilicoccus caccae]GMA38055.1 MFS transporter [Mobilicoccus caccae]
MTSAAPTTHTHAESTDPHTTRTLRVLTVATFIVILNETIMVNALPVLMDALSIDARAAQWLSTGFMLTMAIVIPTTGWFLQRVGRRTAFIVAMSCFSAGTLLAALAPSFQWLLLGRVIQASGTAVMMPLLMSSVLALVPMSHRGRVMGNVSLAISVAPAMGPAISGVILGFASWRWLFGVVLPIAVLIGVMGARMLRAPVLMATDVEIGDGATADDDEGAAPAGALDIPSVLLTVVGFGGLVYGLSHIGGEGEATGTAGSEAAGFLLGLPMIALVVGIVGVALFAWRQIRLQRRTTPLLDLRVLRHGAYLLSVSVMALAFMGLMGAMIMLPMYFQEVRGMSTLEAGLMLMPGGLIMGVLGPVVGRLYDRLGPARLVIPGSVALACGLGLLAWSTTHGPWWLFLVLHIGMSVALAFIFTPVFTAGLSALPSHLYGHGSALLGTLQQVAAAAGTALVITVMSVRTATLVAAGGSPAASLGGGVQSGLVVATVLAVMVAALSFLFLRVQVTESDRPVVGH